MARPGIDYDAVKMTAVKLLSQGIAPSVQKIRELLGTGSHTTIAEHLKAWREDYAEKAIHHLSANMPKELVGAMEALWQTAMDEAQKQFSTYKETIQNQNELILQSQKDTEKNVASLKENLTEAAHKLEAIIFEKQKVTTDLAVANDRLSKKDEILFEQKERYEMRLKRAYEDKDHLIAQNNHLQAEIKKLQEQLTFQSEEHKKYLTQHNLSQEQSENRWLKLIDQARQEAKEMNKKLEAMRRSHEEQVKKGKNELTQAQQTIYEQSARLKISSEQVSQFKKEIETLRTENLQEQSKILKLENELRLKYKRSTVRDLKEKISV